jgi:AcrR family transcriptional regulator
VSATTEPVSRRARLRAETIREITGIALRQIATDGPGAISLRGIAREMGMTARAIYSYFPTRDDLVTALIGDIAAGHADALEATRDAVPEDDPRGRLLAWGHAFRNWALANREGFQLLYGDPVPGYQPPPDGGPVEQASRRICLGLNNLVAAACPHAEPTGTVGWPDFPAGYLARIQAGTTNLSPAVAALALRVWGRLHGLVTLEVHGHLRPVFNDPATLFEAELLDVVG